jgi:hypothetical protein
MTPSLPANPSLRFLKEQAKDVLRAHKAGDSSSCQVLRKLRRFDAAADADILAAEVPLKEIQFALAMHYGFKSWDELKTHVMARDIPERITKKCWETSAFHVGNEYVLDAEATGLNRMALALGDLPDWAVRVREAMPKYGFELCSHRWLEGLQHLMRMVGTQKAWRSKAGRCGDVPKSVMNAALRRADAVEAWLAGRKDNGTLRLRVAETLGQPTSGKTEAAQCFVELVRQFFTESGTDDEAMNSAKRWRARSPHNPILSTMFEGEGFDGLLQNRCGYRIIARLDIYIEIIGGDQARADERHGVCNDQIRYILRDDPRRFTVTRGYLWGMYAYLSGHDADWLNENKPECAESAIHALTTVSQAGPPAPLRYWLVASLLKAAKTWVQKVAIEKWYDTIPEYPKDLPELPKMA